MPLFLHACLRLLRLLLCSLTCYLFLGVRAQAQAPSLTIHGGLPTGNAGKVLYGNGIYFASFMAPTSFYTSPDGLSWVPVAVPPLSPNPAIEPALAFGAGLFVCAGDSGKIFTSADGKVWTRRASGTGARLMDVRFVDGAGSGAGAGSGSGAGGFYAVGDSAVLLTSADGLSWSRLSLGVGAANDSYQQIIYGNGYFVITAYIFATGDHVLYRSAAGATGGGGVSGGSGSSGLDGAPGGWTADTVAMLRKICFVRDRFYLFTNTVAVAADATGWTDISASNPVFAGAPMPLGGFTDGNKVYLVGNTGGDFGVVYASADGLTFDAPMRVTILPAGGAYIASQYFIYGSGGIERSTDGVAYLSEGVSYRALASDGLAYVALGGYNAKDAIFRSTDFENWTQTTPPDTPSLFDIAYYVSRYLTTGASGIYSSPDGEAWTRIGPALLPAGQNASLLSLATGGGRYVSLSNYLYTSSDAVTWSPNMELILENKQPVKVKYVNGYFFMIAANTTSIGYSILYSPTGDGWIDITPQLSFPVYSFDDFVSDGSKVYILGTEMGADNYPKGFFSIASADFTDPQSWIKGAVTTPPEGSMLNGSAFAYSNGHFVGVASDINRYGYDYLLYSSDGVHWSDTLLGPVSSVAGLLPEGDRFRLLTTSNYQITIDFSSGGTLPITLLDLEASAVGATTLLSWKTAMESGSSRFTVQRSSDGVSWDSIGVVKAAGQSSTAIGYRMVDDHPLKGYDYYRLLLVDLDGRMQVSPVRQVFFGAAAVVTVYPNPAVEMVTVQLSDGTKSDLLLYDAGGAVVLRRAFSGGLVTVSLQGLPAGIYHLWVRQNGKSYYRQILRL